MNVVNVPNVAFLILEQVARNPATNARHMCPYASIHKDAKQTHESVFLDKLFQFLTHDFFPLLICQILISNPQAKLRKLVNQDEPVQGKPKESAVGDASSHCLIGVYAYNSETTA
jgi:hypothetical protein